MHDRLPVDNIRMLLILGFHVQASGYGHLKEGYLEECSTALARKLLASPTAPVLAALGTHVQYEIAVGMNGRLWIRAGNVTTTILVTNAIIASEFLYPAQCNILVSRLVSAASKPQT